MSDTPLHATALPDRPALARLDPRTRILVAAAAVVTVLALRTVPLQAAALGGAIALAVVCGPSLRVLLARLAHVEGFLLVLVVLLPLTLPGPSAFTLGPLAVSAPGLWRALDIVLRVTTAATVVTTLLAGLEPVRLGHALARLGASEKLVHILLFAARWVPLVVDETRRQWDGLRARGFRLRATRHGLATLAHLIGRLLVRGLDRGRRIDEAMRCRAFTGRFALVDDSRFTARDRVAAGLAALPILALLALDRLP